MSAARIRRIVRQELAGEAEDKSIDVALGATNISDTPGLQLLCPIGQGTDYFQRLGVEARLLRCYVRYRCLISAVAVVAGVQSQNLRFMLVLDTLTLGVALPVTGATAAAQATSLFPVNVPLSLVQQRNFRATTRYLVLRDWTVSLNVNGRAEHYGEMSCPLRMNVHWTGNTTGVADILANALWLVYWSDTPAASNPPIISWQARLWFRDL